MRRIECPTCGEAYDVSPEAAGKATTCKRCGGRFKIPGLPAAKVVREATLATAEPPGDSEPARQARGTEDVVWLLVKVGPAVAGVNLVLGQVVLATPGARLVISLAVGFGVGAMLEQMRPRSRPFSHRSEGDESPTSERVHIPRTRGSGGSTSGSGGHTDLGRVAATPGR